MFYKIFQIISDIFAKTIIDNSKLKTYIQKHKNVYQKRKILPS